VPSRDVTLLLASLVLATIPAGYLLVVLPLYLNRLGIEPALIGFLYSLSGLVTAVLIAFSGVLADRFGRRLFLLLGTALPVISYAIFAFTTERGWLVLASLLGGVGLANGAAGALTGAAFDAMLAEHTHPRQRTAFFAWAQALWAIALGVGSFAAAAPELIRALNPSLDDLAAYQPPFIAIIVLAVVATALLAPLSEQPASRGTSSLTATGWLPRQSIGVIVRYTIAIGWFGLGLGIAVQLLPLWFNLRFGTAEGQLGPWVGAAQVLSLSSVVVAPWLDRRFGSSISIMGVHFVGGLALLFIGLVAPVFEAAAVAYLVRNVVSNFAWPLQQALLMGNVVPDERATAAGVGFAAWGLANAVGPFVAGVLIQTGSLALPLVLGAMAYALGGLAFGIGFRKRQVS
jgi:MFS family permease